MPIYGMSTKYLRDFVTSEREYLRKITRMPNNEYRMWEEDQNKEESKQMNASHSMDEVYIDEDDIFNEFVIIDRPDVEKYNQLDKLNEEIEIKDSGTS